MGSRAQKLRFFERKEAVLTSYRWLNPIKTMKTTLSHFRSSIGVLGFTLLASSGYSDTQFVDVPATANIFSAGLSAPVQPGGGGAGILPIMITLGSGQNAFQFSATGQISQYYNYYIFGADGWNGAAPNINSYGGISGFHADTLLALTGVFLSDSTPQSPAPDALNFTSSGLGADFLYLSPELGQLFFIGDGLTSGNAAQTFFVPDGATRLFLGYADAFNGLGDPGYYDDNVGSLNVGVTEVPVPEPSSAMLAGAAFGIIMVLLCRKKTEQA